MQAVAIFLVGAFGSLTACAASQSKPMVVVPIEGATFAPSDPARPSGTQIAVLRGDPASGPSVMLMKLKSGGGDPHVHSADYQLVVVQGTMKHWDKKQTEASAKPLGPGSYWFQPGGKAHGDVCLTDECLLYIVWSGKRDGRLATEQDP